jgi:hypothetical protein
MDGIICCPVVNLTISPNGFGIGVRPGGSGVALTKNRHGLVE